MSTIPSVTFPDAASTAGHRRDQRPGLGRLTAVELRKMLNTRAGFWVPVGVALITVVTAIIASATYGGQNARLASVFQEATLPSEFLLPVIGVLLICGEWSQRTTLTTFVLVPSRWRVIAAKLGACALVATVATVGSVIATFLCVAVFGHAPDGAGSLPWQVVSVQAWLFLAAGMITGLAFGAAILVGAPAVVAYLLLPTVWDGVVGGVPSLQKLADWIDPSQTLEPLVQHTLSASAWAHTFTTLVVWIGVPFLIGWARIGRGDLA